MRPTRTGLLVSTPSGWPNLRRKGAQSLNALIGLWLGYSGIFANPPANINNVLLAPPSPSWGWCSTRWVTGAASLVCFRDIPLVGMLTAIAAMWSMLHRCIDRRGEARAHRRVSLGSSKGVLAIRRGPRIEDNRCRRKGLAVYTFGEALPTVGHLRRPQRRRYNFASPISCAPRSTPWACLCAFRSACRTFL